MIEIAIQENWQTGFSTDIYISNKIDNTLRLFLQPDGSWTEVPITDLTRRDDIKPTLRLPMDLGRELTERLLEHYHGADDARAAAYSGLSAILFATHPEIWPMFVSFAKEHAPQESLGEFEQQAMRNDARLLRQLAKFLEAQQ